METKTKANNKSDNFDPFKAFHDRQPPIVMHYYGDKEDFLKFATSVIETVDFTTKRVIVQSKKDDMKIIIFNPLASPELIQPFPKKEEPKN
jgi:hypothetical protein